MQTLPLWICYFMFHLAFFVYKLILKSSLTALSTFRSFIPHLAFSFPRHTERAPCTAPCRTSYGISCRAIRVSHACVPLPSSFPCTLSGTPSDRLVSSPCALGSTASSTTCSCRSCVCCTSSFFPLHSLMFWCSTYCLRGGQYLPLMQFRPPSQASHNSLAMGFRLAGLCW